MTDESPRELPAAPPAPPIGHPRIEPHSIPTRLSRRSLLLIAALLLAAAGFLLPVKKGREEERATLATLQARATEQRAATNGEIIAAMEARYGGTSKHTEQLALVARVGNAIATKSDAAKAAMPLKFHLLAEENSINIFGLSTGDVYVTTALLNRMKTEGQLAAALAHAAAHALAGDGLTPLAATPKQPLPVWQHTPAQERIADAQTVKLLSQSGYDPNAMGGMLVVLATAYRDGADVSFFTTHPNDADRLNHLAADIAALYPEGVPKELSK